ncbi:RsmE family RNA methyltransferase [Spiroplasma cantharicola]|uniref:Ribosomal RNA small subunit methyltransferase E n=1 Tax=Spiroplasma cantharicola TaxID=362837 RepID=A0A0M4JS16_9MOLU|nr:RsmE family RNA methyltransferase [Spiroplasma cantharicola]ALD66260.1 16S rRNA (uracil1498-N3)-methyltransferase [Spiroplasma cantharicola]
MHSFFLDRIEDNYFEIVNDNFHHIKNVIKLKEDEQIFCIYKNEKYLCSIFSIRENSCKAKIISKIKSSKKNYKVNLILGIIREQKWDFVLQKATELGVDNIIPVEFKRNVVKIDIKNEPKKLTRWYTICESAAKQSKRIDIPTINSIVRNLEELENYKADINLVCWEEETSEFLKKEIIKEFKSINIIIGPEGGIDDQEIKKLNNIGYKSIGLGDNIMRAETAPLFVLSCLSYEKNGG